MVHLETRGWDLAYAWWRNPPMPNTLKYAPAIITYEAEGGAVRLLLAYETANPDVGRRQRQYGGRSL